ncbi:MAG TPA: DUF1326 domain-containing protein [Dehalococcoidia bacterium]|nr:DUF1326 domain-containing protein [Dehalococcoidia bacterium]
MAWRISGTYWAPCSCKVSCPCELGEPEGDQGWCSGSIAFEIGSGNVDGTDVSGSKVVFVGDWPSGFISGNGTGRLYFDTAVSQEQRAALESLLSGQRGGVFEVFASLVPKVLPSKEAPINIAKGAEETRITVGDFGELISKPLRGASGEVTKLLHGAFAFRDEIILAKGSGSRWRDPEMRQWESGGHSEQSEFDWSG